WSSDVCASDVEAADNIAVFTVPFTPEDWKIAYLIPPDSQVPRLSDEFELGQDRILMDDVKKGPELIDFIEFSGERAGEIKTEAIHLHLGSPVTQTDH